MKISLSLYIYIYIYIYARRGVCEGAPGHGAGESWGCAAWMSYGQSANQESGMLGP